MLLDPKPARRVVTAVAGIPRDADGPVFREPWEAQAFAMVLVLHERGMFTWPEWASTLADEIKRAQAAGDPDTGDTYYQHWLKALERLVAEKGVTTGEMLIALSRCLGLRRRPHPARSADRATPGRFPVKLNRKGYSAGIGGVCRLDCACMRFRRQRPKGRRRNPTPCGCFIG